MSFFTEIQIPEFSRKMDYSKKMMLFGSCFSENIGQKLSELKHQVDMNPFGILYNPESIANGLKILIENRVFTTEDLFCDQGLWNSFYHHSRFSDVDAEIALEKINSRIKSSSEFLKNADFLVLTFGTSWVYELKKTGKIVSNCHKIPAAEFKRFRLGVYEITETYHELLELIWQFNPNLKVVFTVSPIRHWKDGAIENQVSKATLLLAIDRLRSGFGDISCGYFPSYEIVMDELRDYRFYAEDMFHLTPLTVDYIFEKFTKAIISNESAEVSKEIMKISRAMAHRAVNKTSVEYKKFLTQNLSEIGILTDRFPYLDFSIEKNHFEKEMATFINY